MIKIKISKQILCIFLLCTILVSCEFYQTKDPIKISVKVINLQTTEPRKGDTIVVRKVKKPWYSMWQYIEVAKGVTDSLGIVLFTIDRNKRHRFSTSGMYPEFGSREFIEQQLKENDTIIIKVKSIPR